MGRGTHLRATLNEGLASYSSVVRLVVVISVMVGGWVYSCHGWTSSHDHRPGGGNAFDTLVSVQKHIIAGFEPQIFGFLPRIRGFV